jgi:AmmeMemoRadiSam system protein B
MRLNSLRNLIAAAFLAAAFGFGCMNRPNVSSLPSAPIVSTPAVEREEKAHPINARTFIDEARFRAFWTKDLSNEVIPKNVIAGVVNHHALASDLLANFFRRLKMARPDLTRVIILSPDHYHVGRGTISTHTRPYSTPNGEVFIDTTSTRQLIEEGIATDESSTSLFEKEHGVGTLVPFLRHEFSDVGIVPIAILGKLPRPEAIAFGTWLDKIVDDHTMILISADMSHYLPESVANENDVVTLEALKTLDATRFGRVNDDFTDNGASFVILRSFLDSRGIDPTFTLFDHSISTRYGGPADDTTSYLTGVWSAN